MAGHSKWANIQHRKGAQDKRRAKLFTKLIRELTVAARGGADPAVNPRLRLAMERARAQSMPKDTIDRAVKRGSGEAGGDAFEQVVYEGYGPGGVAVMVDALTDNRNRTVAEVRHVFARSGGNLGAEGSVSYLFNHVGLFLYPAGTDEEHLTEAAVAVGAEDVVANDDGSFEVLSAPAEFDSVRNGLAAAGLEPESAELTWRASLPVDVAGDDAETTFRLLEELEDLDDVQQVYSNVQFADGFGGDG